MLHRGSMDASLRGCTSKPNAMQHLKRGQRVASPCVQHKACARRRMGPRVLAPGATPGRCPPWCTNYTGRTTVYKCYKRARRKSGSAGAVQDEPPSPVSDQYVEDYVQDVSNIAARSLYAMTNNKEDVALELIVELQAKRSALLAENEAQGALFLSLLQRLLNHDSPKEAAENLTGPYFKAFNQICAGLEGSGWKLNESGQPGPSGAWDAAEQAARNGWAQATRPDMGTGAQAGGKAPVHTELYSILRVAPSASQGDIKSAYRKLALKEHPDVSDAPDAQDKFIEISNAYDILSDEDSRRLYDMYGKEGMKNMTGAMAGSGNARKAWDEFKPYKRENKSTKARDASRSSYGGASTDEKDTSGEPVAGDIVEYPLSDVVKAELQDGRRAGVGLLVGRNVDRPDAEKLPPDTLQLCEIEPLRQEEEGSNRWIPDELLPSAYCRLGDLKIVPVDQYDSRFDLWEISASLSPGCGGPELVEEIMV